MSWQKARITRRLSDPEVAEQWRQGSCAGKVSFDSPQMAYQTARRQRFPGKHYRCLICGKFHIYGVGRKNR